MSRPQSSALQKAKQALQHIALPLAVQPAKPGDLTFAQDDRDIFQTVRPAETVKAQHFLGTAVRLWLCGEQVINALADHLADDRAVVVSAIFEGFDMRTIAKNRDTVRKAFDLVEPVRNEQHANTPIPLCADQAKHFLHNGCVECRGGLIQDQELWIAGQGFGDFNLLSLGQ